MEGEANILIIDDEVGSLLILESILKGESYSIQRAIGSKEAVEFIGNYKYDLIIMDIAMPEIKDLEAIKKVKSLVKSSNISIIIINDLDDKLDDFEYGGGDFISKPFREKEVLARVKLHLQLKNLKERLELKDQEQKILFDNIDTQVWYLKDERTYGSINRSHAKFIGLKSEEVEGNNLYKFYGKEEGDICVAGNREVFSEGRVVESREWIKNFEGELRLLSIVKSPKLDKKGKVEHVVCSANDITDRYQLEKKLEEHYKRIEMQNIELESLYSSLEEELDKASKIHEQFLPKSLPQVEGISYGRYYQPSAQIGGDFYNVIKVGERLIFYLADVTGHGIDSSMLNIFLRETINSFLLYENKEGDTISSSKVVQFVRERYKKESFPADYFICLLIGILDLRTMELNFSNAGFHIPPIFITSGGEQLELSSGGMPISALELNRFGMELSSVDNQEESFYLDQGDKVFLATDGIFEEYIDGEQYGEGRVKEILRENYRLPADLIIQKINQEFASLTGGIKGQDDITILILQRDFPIIDRFEVSIKSNYGEVSKSIKEVEAFLSSYYSGGELLCMGFQEMIINAIEHGNEYNEGKKIQITVEVTKNHIKGTVKDEGEGFDWRDKLGEKLDLEKEFEGQVSARGRGIRLTSMVYDQLWYNEEGNEVNLLKVRE